MIHLGYEVGTGRAVEIPLRHLVVTGQTQESGKTTTLEALITRSGLRAVAFVTKRGESSFHVANPIPPYFRERTDWPFVASLLEATLGEKLKIHRSSIMKLCQTRDGRDGQWKAPKTLADVQRNAQTALVKARGFSESIYTELDEYLRSIVPQLERMPYSTRLDLEPCLNVMDLLGYDFPVQALVVRSAIDWIRHHERKTIVVVPEAWKFAPKQHGSPVRQASEEFIREGGALGNFLWIDTQDVAGVADPVIRQVGVWIFGVQRARHEIKRTLDHIPESLAHRPKPSDIATLGKGQFVACWDKFMFKVYVQPAWMSAAFAQAIARGEQPVSSAREILREFDADRAAREMAAMPEASLDKTSGGSTEGSAAPYPGAEAGSIPARRSTEEDEAMWKAKHDELLKEHQTLIETHDALAARVRELEEFPSQPGSVASGGEAAGADAEGPSPAPNPSVAWPSGGGGILSSANGGFEALYRYVVDRAAKDPGILELLARRPELRVAVDRPVVQADGETPRGRLALLIFEDFFQAPRTVEDIRREFLRRGWIGSKTNNSVFFHRNALPSLVESGFLSKEPTGYLTVPGMKVSIREVAQ
jgi:hypothetical protein